MDVQMPVMDGIAVTHHIRDKQSSVLCHDLPIIAMTAHALNGDNYLCLNAGMNDYVTKLIEPQALEQCLNAGWR
jgi:CheY-like chemotaxis protein